MLAASILSRLPLPLLSSTFQVDMRITHAELYRIDLQTRIPFKYGIATMTRMPEVFLRLRVNVDGAEASGVSSDCLPPKWFTKVPEKPIDAEIEEMLAVIRQAMQTAREMDEPTPFALWAALYERQNRWATEQKVAPLLAHFGTSLVERALIDSFCRAHRTTFARALQDNLFGIAPGMMHPEWRGRAPGDFLPRTPLSKVLVRHTVGLGDPLAESDIPPNERLADGLPQSLEALAQRYGLRHFKIKVNGNLESDTDRLGQIARVLEANAFSEFRFSLDANEQFRSFAQFREYWGLVTGCPRLREFFYRLLFVEQPLHRDVALAPKVESELKSWPERPPIIIDESDGTLDAVAAAMRLGYAGASHKNCKGVFKGILNRCFLRHANAIMTGEDLCNIGPVALPQDLAVMAALGIESVERNGHHYHAGLSQFPEAIQKQVLAGCPDLYRKSERGWPALHITHGTVSLDSINIAPFGVNFDLDTSELTPVL